MYVSATGASELKNLGYMERLGLWGQGTDFDSASAFSKDVGSRGGGAMEMVSMVRWLSYCIDVMWNKCNTTPFILGSTMCIVQS